MDAELKISGMLLLNSGSVEKYSGLSRENINPGRILTPTKLNGKFTRHCIRCCSFTQPDRVNGMITTMLQMYKEGGRLPMWPNPAETNIMISTHADAVIADAYVKGVRGYHVKLY